MNRLKALSVAVPLLLVLALIGLQSLVLERFLTQPLVVAVTLLLAAAGTAVFSVAMWRAFTAAEFETKRALDASRRQAEQLEALSAAALSLTADLSLEAVLQRVVDLSRGVIGARFGALAVIGPGGVIEQFMTSGLDAETRAALGPMPAGRGLLGVAVSERRALLSADIEADPRSVGFPSGHPPMRTLASVPIVYGEEVIGSLYLAERNDGRPFDEGDRLMLERLAAHAAAAVTNARLYVASRRLSLMEERQRIAMDLHDGVLQSIYGAQLAIQACLWRMQAEPEAVSAELETVVARLDDVISDVRRYVVDLRSTWQRDDGFSRQMHALVESVSSASGPRATLDSRGDFGDVPREHQWHLWHVAHEALSNAIRHGRAQHVDLHMLREDGRLRLQVVDDGSGFDPEVPRDGTHQGLDNMRRRMQALGGSLIVRSAPESGTTITAEVPIPPPRGKTGGA